MALGYGFGLDGVETPKPEHMTAEILGGKGWGLSKMSSMGLPVPPGVTLTTEAHMKGLTLEGEDKIKFVYSLIDDYVYPAVDAMPMPKGCNVKPLLSVRSGAPVSMPGMMDTILNVGINDDNLDEYAEYLGRWAALDSYRRLIQMMGSTAYDIDHGVFEAVLEHFRETCGVKEDKDFCTKDMGRIVVAFKQAFEKNAGLEFPQNLKDQLCAAICTVFDSWDLPRAKHYRKMEGISDSMGTAVNVQMMVFGNLNNASGSGVFFTRDPNTGANEVYGEFLTNAQGEDVVAGIRTPLKLSEMMSLKGWEEIASEIVSISAKLEEFYEDMVDCEFTVEDGKLYMLQSRKGKRTGPAAIRIALDFVDEGMIDPVEVLNRVSLKQYKACMIDFVDPSYDAEPCGVGIAACSGVVTGKIAFSADRAVEMSAEGPVILVTKETTPDDIHGMEAAVGILTKTGGTTSHAAVVARAMNRPCVTGLTALDFGFGTSVSIDGVHKANEGDPVTIDGASGRVWFEGEVPVVSLKDAEFMKDFETLVSGQTSVPYLHEPGGSYPDGASVWLSRMDYPILKDVIETIKTEIPKTVKLILDFRNELALYGTPDRFLYDSVLAKNHVPVLAHLGDFEDIEDRLPNSIAIGASDATAKYLASKGCTVVGPAKTVKDFVEGIGTYMEPEDVKMVFGDAETMMEVLKKLAVPVVSLTHRPATREGLVMQALGSKE